MMLTPDSDARINTRVLRGAASNYVGRFAGLVVWFVFTPFVLHHLGPAEYGLWVVIGSVVGYGWVFNLGIGAALVKYVAEYYARGETDRAHHFIATSLVLFTLLGLVCFALSICLAPLLPVWLHLPAEEQSTATWVIILMGAELGVAMPCSTGTSVLQGLQRYDLVNLVTTGATVATVAAMGAALLLGGGVVAMVAVTIPLTLANQLLSTWFIHRIAPQLRFGWRGAQAGSIRGILSFSGPLFLMQLAELLQRKTDEIVVAALMVITAVTPYSLARRLADLTRRLTDQFVRVLLPLASELHAGNELVQLKALYTTGTRLSLALLLPMTCTLFVLGGAILSVWVGPAYAEYESVVRILALAALVSTSQGPAVSVLKGIARHRPLAISALVAGVVNLGLSIALIRPFGLEGVALGTLIPTVAESLGFVFPYALWVLRVPVSQVLKEVVLPSLAPAALMSIALYVGAVVIHPSNLPSLLLVVSLGCLIYLFSYLSLSATPMERQLWRSLFYRGTSSS
jgi:O-antigen/teichoic acid export membrane protein